MLGVIVVVAKGIECIWDFDGTWLGYRKASEAMKREKRLFVNGAMDFGKREKVAVSNTCIERITPAYTERDVWEGSRIL